MLVNGNILWQDHLELLVVFLVVEEHHLRSFGRLLTFVKSLIVSARHDSLSQLQYKLCKHVFSNVC